MIRVSHDGKETKSLMDNAQLISIFMKKEMTCIFHSGIAGEVESCQQYHVTIRGSAGRVLICCSSSLDNVLLLPVTVHSCRLL